MQRILLSEADDTDRDEFSRKLQSHGYAVASVRTPEKAVEFVHEYELDVVVISFGVRPADSIIAARTIKSTPMGSRICVIALTPQPVDSSMVPDFDGLATRTDDLGHLVRQIRELTAAPTREERESIHQAEAASPSFAEQFQGLCDTICHLISTLHPRLPELGESGPVALTNMESAAANLRHRLASHEATHEPGIPDSVRDHHIRHDFRNLLAAVNGFSEILLLEDDLANDLRLTLSTIKKNGTRFCDLLDQVKDCAA